MSRAKSPNVVRHQGGPTRIARSQALGQQGAIVWFTGLSGSGKSTVATEVEHRLLAEGRAVYLLDGDGLRLGLNGDLGFSPEDRTENIRRVGEVAALFRDSGMITLAAFVSPYRSDRDRVRGLVEENAFFEIFVDTPLATCEARDPKGLYRKARSGEIKNFTGIQAPYEAPSAPELTLDTSTLSVEDCAQQVIELLRSQGLLSPKL
jgi:adenylylsulfate kinase